MTLLCNLTKPTRINMTPKNYSHSREKNTYVIDQKQSHPWDFLKRSPRTMQLKKSPAKSPAYI